MKKLSDLHKKYGKDIHEVAKKYKIDESILAGLIWQESRGNAHARSHCGAYGLTQVMPSTAKDRGYRLDTARHQIDAGGNYLRWLCNNFVKDENVERMLAAYNAGPGRLRNDRWKRFSETSKYVQVVPLFAESYRVLLELDKVEEIIEPPKEKKWWRFRLKSWLWNRWRRH